MQFGDRVEYDLRASHGGDLGYGYVIGVPKYSDGYEHIVMLADESSIGMPINAEHCKVVGRDEALATTCRARWDKRYPDFLVPL
jgi:hypothetical protein